MGKNLIQQARGKGGPTYRAPSFRYLGEVKYKHLDQPVKGTVIDIVHCPGHSAPLIQIQYENGKEGLLLSCEGMKVGDKIEYGEAIEIKAGNIAKLKDIPEGTLIYNIELNPGDGGKLVRTSGTFAKVIAHLQDKSLVLLPSKKEKLFASGCKATIGIIAGSGRLEKPFYKAGNRFYKMRAKNKLYPIVSGQSMNAVDHPHGGSRSSKKNYPYTVSRDTPPGAKVGKVSPKRTGRTKR